MNREREGERKRGRKKTRLTDSAHGGRERIGKRGRSRDEERRENVSSMEESDGLPARLRQEKKGFLSSASHVRRKKMGPYLGVQTVWDLEQKEEKREVGHGFPA